MEKKNNENNRFGYMNESKKDLYKRTNNINNTDKLTSNKRPKTYEKLRKSNIYNFKSTNTKPKLVEIYLTYLKRTKSRYQTLKKIIIETLTKSNFQTSVELSEFINTNFKEIYKRNTISEACSQLIFEKIIRKRNRYNNGKIGRPHIEFYIHTEKKRL